MNSSIPAPSFPIAANGQLVLNEQELDRLRELVASNLGIQLTDQKRALVMARLQKHVRELGFSTFSEYTTYVASDTTGRAVSELANRISTNHTFFFREPLHFRLLGTRVLPELTEGLRASGAFDLRIWCAACATGEEAYTLAMVLAEHLGSSRPSWQAGLLATDVSERALQVAMRGVYPEDRLRDVAPTLLSKYFGLACEGQRPVSESLKSEVTFRRFNLMNERFPFKRPFHVIFCRNVMIYFDQSTRDRLVARLADSLVPGGYLFVGHSESLGRAPPGLSYVQPAVYRREER
jgi:chemotaxis protein methyltransferase CheR